MKRTFLHVLGTAALATAAFTLPRTHAADVTAYSVGRGQLYDQDSAGAATTNQFGLTSFLATVEGNVNQISEATVGTPSPFGDNDEPLGSVGDRLEDSVQSISQLIDTLYGAGTYTFTITSQSGVSTAHLNLAVGPYPSAVPHISNYDAAQNIDAGANFTLTFDPFTGASGNDHYELVIMGNDGNTLLRQTGTGTSAVIAANKLEADSTYDAILRFIHPLSQDTTSIAGAVGTTTAFNETDFSISTSSQSTGGTTGGGTNGGDDGGTGSDTTPPTLALTSPADGATGVSNPAVSFLFDDTMAATHSIQWSANVNAAALQYQWVGGSVLMVSGTFPANAQVTWTLNPNPASADAFRDTAGNALATISGGFQTSGSTGGTTGGGTNGGLTGGTTGNDPCDPNNTPEGFGGAAILKELSYTQTAATAPTLDAENPAFFFESFSPATNQTVSSVTITGPAGTKTLSKLAGDTYFDFENYTNAAELEASEPAGNYTIAIGGVGSAQVAVGAVTSLPIPQFLNLSDLITMDVTKDFTLRFAPFTGAGASDSISLNIQADQDGGEFNAPDYCKHIELPNNAVSVTIPANTFLPGHKYSGSIHFSHFTFDTNAIPNTYITAGAMVQTSFDFTQGTVTPPTAPTFAGNIIHNPDGTLTFNVQADAGETLIIEGADSVNGPWSQVTTLTGSSQFNVDPKLAKTHFYRARVQQ